MDKFWSNNSELSKEEIKNKYPENEKVQNSLISQKLNKSKVMRVNKTEEELLVYLRKNNIEDISEELRTVLSCTYNVCSAPHLKEITSILSTKQEINTAQYLIDTGFITEEQLAGLLNALNNRRNIIITGNVGVGKNFLMNALLNLQEGMKFNLITDNSCNFSLSEDFFNNNTVNFLPRDILISNFINPQYKSNIFAFEEVCMSSDVLAFATALDMYKQIIATISLNVPSNLIQRLCSFFDNEEQKQHMYTVFNRSKLIIVNISIKDGKRFVSSITGLEY